MWPNHTSVPGTRLRGCSIIPQTTDTPWGHVSLEGAQRAEAAPVSYRLLRADRRSSDLDLERFGYYGFFD